MTVEAIKTAIEELSEEERDQVAQWIEALQEQAWDRQMGKDFAPGGRGRFLLDEVRADIVAGRIRPLDDVSKSRVV